MLRLAALSAAIGSHPQVVLPFSCARYHLSKVARVEVCSEFEGSALPLPRLVIVVAVSLAAAALVSLRARQRLVQSDCSPHTASVDPSPLRARSDCTTQSCPSNGCGRQRIRGGWWMFARVFDAVRPLKVSRAPVLASAPSNLPQPSTDDSAPSSALENLKNSWNLTPRCLPEVQNAGEVRRDPCRLDLVW